MDVALVYQADSPNGGTGSWTAHLYRGLKSAGYDPGIIKIGDNNEIFDIDDIECHVISCDEVLDICREMPSIIAATYWKYSSWLYDLIDSNCILVYHTRHTHRHPKKFLDQLYRKDTQIIAVRPAIRDYVIDKELKPENVVYIPHMYISRGSSELPRTKNAVCTTRIATWKNVDIIAKANNILVDRNGNMDKCVYLHGHCDESHVKKKFIGKIRGWDDPVNFTGPMYPFSQHGFENGDGYDICSDAGFAIDLTNFPGDNTDLQYCALEMIDAGCVYVGHAKYVDGKVLIPNRNCLSTDDPYDLADILTTSHENYQNLTKNARELLEKHKPEHVIHYYDELFDRMSL